MTPNIVVDIGNTRMKWGRCYRTEVMEMVSLPLNDVQAWEEQLRKWDGWPLHDWAVAGVNPERIFSLIEWLTQRECNVLHIQSYEQLPIKMNVDRPEKVGLDRLLGIVAARGLTPQGRAAITIDIGTAMTVNLVDGDGFFQGGAILPGVQLMAKALNQNTAALPLANTESVSNTAALGKSTETAIQAGIRAAIRGAAQILVKDYAQHDQWMTHLYITGGGMNILQSVTFPESGWTTRVPELNLQGLLQTAASIT